VIEVLGGSVKLHKFPMSPTSNHMLMVIRGRLIKSNDARKYSKQCELWGAQNRGSINKLKEILKDKTLRVDCCFVFPRSKLITKKNTLKKVDWGNRVKQTHDELAKLIGVDDSHFISGYCEKSVGKHDNAFVDIEISIEEMEVRK
jgi:hypothetical protein